MDDEGRTPVSNVYLPRKDRAARLRRRRNHAPISISVERRFALSPRSISGSDEPHCISFRDNSSKSLESSFVYDPSNGLTYFDQCFEKKRTLGYGSFGEVAAVRSKEDGKMYAVKISRSPYRSEKDRERRLSEVKRHELLSPHPNCLRFVRAWEEKDLLYIQMELCSTTLENLCLCADGPLPEEDVCNYATDILMGLKHLHDNDLIHLDVKPENILIKDGICKLGDFGLIVDLKEMKGDEDEDWHQGDSAYMAPEVMEDSFSKAADIFSLGVTMLEIALYLELPRDGVYWHDMRHGVLPREVTSLSIELQRVLRLMLHPDPEKRATADELLDMDIFKRRIRLRRRRFLMTRIRNSVIFNLTPSVWYYRLTFFLHFVSYCLPEDIRRAVVTLCEKLMALMSALFWIRRRNRLVTPPLTPVSLNEDARIFTLPHHLETSYIITVGYWGPRLNPRPSMVLRFKAGCIDIPS
ncbi:unnamed protein product, partial [Cyprideis torosa]